MPAHGGAESQQGFGLPEVMVAMGLSTVVGLAILSQLKNLTGAALKLASSGDLSSIAAQINRSVSCEKTFAGRVLGNPCGTGGGFIDLLSDGETVITAAGGSRFGPWTVRAR